jgi:hypothetical protein
VRTTARNNAAGQPNAAGENVLSPAEMDDTTEAPPRPRVTETGPMLPENLGPPPSMTLDMGSESQGPMGLEPAQISRGMDPLLPRFGACAEATTDDQGHGPHGRVTIRLRIRNHGRAGLGGRRLGRVRHVRPSRRGGLALRPFQRPGRLRHVGLRRGLTAFAHLCYSPPT